MGRESNKHSSLSPSSTHMYRDIHPHIHLHTHTNTNALNGPQHSTDAAVPSGRVQRCQHCESTLSQQSQFPLAGKMGSQEKRMKMANEQPSQDLRHTQISRWQPGSESSASSSMLPSKSPLSIAPASTRSGWSASWNMSCHRLGARPSLPLKSKHPNVILLRSKPVLPPL